MKITFIVKGTPIDFKRIDHERTVTIYKSYKSGNILYGYIDRFNIISISIEDILKIEE